MTVAELISRLQELPPYAPVMAAGCESEYSVTSVEADTCHWCPAILVRLGDR